MIEHELNAKCISLWEKASGLKYDYSLSIEQNKARYRDLFTATWLHILGEFQEHLKSQKQ